MIDSTVLDEKLANILKILLDESWARLRDILL